MKKLKIISNVFWMLSLIIMQLVILQQYKIINFLPTSINFYHEITLETLNQSIYYRCLINSIGYVLLVLSIAIKFFIFTENKNTYILSIKANWIKILILLFNILLIILTIVILSISLIITFFSLMSLNYTPM